MLDGIKMAAKAALIVGITSGILGIMALVQIPVLDFSLLTQGLSTAMAIGYHWCPGLSVVFPAALAIMGVYVAILAFYISAIAIRWIMKVNE